MRTFHDHELPRLCETLEIPGLFDAHVHFMMPTIMAKVWSYFDAAGPKLGRPWPIHYRLSDADRVARLHAMGVKHFSALSYAHRPGVAQQMNDWTMRFSEQYPSALCSGTFFPEPEAAQYVPALIESGAEIFKAHVQVGEFDPNDPLLDPVWGVLEDAKIPTVLHAGSGPVPGPYTGPQAIATVLQRFPDLPLIIAHLGMPAIVEFCMLAEKYRNVRLDTTMVYVDFFDMQPTAEELARLSDLGDKVLFGSDFPNIPYPLAHQVEALFRLELGDDWMRAVLWHNAANLFGRQVATLS